MSEPMEQQPDKNCITKEDGTCVGKDCMHDTSNQPVILTQEGPPPHVSGMDEIRLRGFMVLVFNGIERLNREQRRYFIKCVRQAKRICDLNYPEGKPDAERPEVKPVELILPPDVATPKDLH